jgi:hypothetical protein
MTETRTPDTAATGGLAAENRPAERSNGESASARVSDRERYVLIALAEHYGWETECLYMSTISDYTGLDRKQVRRSVRSLARKGLAEYVRGLFDDEGMTAGSGYRCTDAGISFLDAWRSGAESRTSGSLQTVTAESDPLVTLQNQHD